MGIILQTIAVLAIGALLGFAALLLLVKMKPENILPNNIRGILIGTFGTSTVLSIIGAYGFKKLSITFIPIGMIIGGGVYLWLATRKKVNSRLQTDWKAMREILTGSNALSIILLLITSLPILKVLLDILFLSRKASF